MDGHLGNGQPARGGAVGAGPTIGVIANPMSGRDIRRLVARASVFPNAEKANMVLRVAAAAGALGVGRVLVSTDSFGISAGVLRAAGLIDVGFFITKRIPLDDLVASGFQELIQNKDEHVKVLVHP